MHDVEHIESMGRDRVLVAVPMGSADLAVASSGTAFPSAPALGALLVAMDKDSAKHPRRASLVCPRLTIILHDPSLMLPCLSHV